MKNPGQTNDVLREAGNALAAAVAEGADLRHALAGEVEIEVEGPKGLVETLIAELKAGNAWAVVRNIEVVWEKFQGKYTGFDIAF